MKMGRNCGSVFVYVCEIERENKSERDRQRGLERER